MSGMEFIKSIFAFLAICLLAILGMLFLAAFYTGIFLVIVSPMIVLLVLIIETIK